MFIDCTHQTLQIKLQNFVDPLLFLYSMICSGFCYVYSGGYYLFETYVDGFSYEYCEK